MQKRLLIFIVMLLYSCTAAAWAQEAVSIEGNLLMLDGKTPHVAVPIQAVVAQASVPVMVQHPEFYPDALWYRTPSVRGSLTI